MSEIDRRISTKSTGQPVHYMLRVVDRLSAVFAFGAAAAVIFLALNVFVDVIGRKFFNTPFLGTLEMTAYWWMPMLTLFAFAFTEQRQEHIKVTILLDALPVRMRQIVEGSFGIITTGLLMALTYYTVVDALRSAGFQQTTPSTPPVLIWPFKFVAVAGVAMLSLQAAATTARYFLGLLPLHHEYDSDTDIV